MTVVRNLLKKHLPDSKSSLSDDACRNAFKDLNILTLPCVYILQCHTYLAIIQMSAHTIKI
ncbi:unnamed protein product [Acanthoscelides obtectus]|uniref:Uncharacterized protein n=1 Tax=Acanthoscelides obtectus TaxID=200917 RepID=A0A9P0PN58_ACAOB|nr:unnamed protein product [Acanthoscelides obtectus]CAK1664556.1 hypothetical protein AOBTE_LOCUS24328 [Acanthoscelides obtectus]